MFERLSDAFTSAYKRLSGKGEISEKNVSEALEQVRTALLDADVQVGVVDHFCEGVIEASLGARVSKSLKPGEEFIGIVYHELIRLLGGEPGEEAEGVRAPGTGDAIMRVSPGPTVILMCGLQGSGKTTTSGKLSAYLKKRGRSVLLAAADLQRPAAVEQLETVAGQVATELSGGARVEFYGEKDKVAEYGKAVGVAVQVARRAVEHARKQGVDTVIIDTAGRLHVSNELMGELKQVAGAVQPHHIFLVVDAMTGQDAVSSAKAFNDALPVDGVILTKFDSDTRGGAAISVRHVTGAPIRFIGVGEKLDALEEFLPERMAGRILGMGDVLSLVEKAHEQVSEEEALKLQAKMAKGELSMEDFLGQLKSLRRMGPMKQILGMLPGVGQMLKDVHVEDEKLDRIEAIINSMTRPEREKPEQVINISRRKRISRGSGTQPEEVSTLVKQFSQLSKLTKTMASMSASDKVRAVKEMGGGMGGMLPGGVGMPGLMGKKGTATAKGRGFKARKKR